MTYRVEITSPAKEEIDSQVAFYLDQGVAAEVTGKWLDSLLNRIQKLAKLPTRFPVSPILSAIRQCEIRVFHHGEIGVFYRVDDDADVVYILAVRHGKRSTPELK